MLGTLPGNMPGATILIRAPEICRAACLLACFVLHLVGSGPTAHAASPETLATFPNRPVRLLLGPAAGGPTDGVARVLAPRLSELWGQPVVVDNRPGASNTIATSLAAKATPDGHTVLLCPLSDAVVPAV